MLVFAVILAFSPLGKVRLGGEDATADYSMSSWIAMLFAAVWVLDLFSGVLQSQPRSSRTGSERRSMQNLSLQLVVNWHSVRPYSTGASMLGLSMA